MTFEISVLQKLKLNLSGPDFNGVNVHNEFKKLHFIGHSLGAHMSAYISHLLKKDNFWEVERITGLDPAKPCFVGVHESLRLDKEDAKFVDVIHTDIGEKNKPWGSLGIRRPIGKLGNNQ